MKFKIEINLVDLLERWNEEKESKVDTYSSWIDEDVCVKTWWNYTTLDWEVDEKEAFKGFVAREISDNINELWESQSMKNQ